jgi:pilus assembly protein CpaF
MTTGHANTPEDMMRRLETMVLTDSTMPVSAIREQIASAVHIVVQLNRFPDGARCVTHVSEIVGIDPDTGAIVVEDIFVYRPPGGGKFADGIHIHSGYIPTFIEEMLVKGVVSLDTFF